MVRGLEEVVLGEEEGGGRRRSLRGLGVGMW